MKRWKLTILCISALAWLPAMAQPSGSFVLTLQQCQDYALRRSFDSRQGQWRLENDALSLRQTEQAIWPTLSGNLGEGLSLGRTIDPFSNNFVQQSIHSGSVGLNANWVVFNGFQRQHQLQQQAYNQQADRADIQRLQQELRLGVIAGYMQVLLSGELVKLAHNQQQTILAQLNRTLALVREGNLSTTQLTDWEAQAATADYELLTAQTNGRQAKLLLQGLLNWAEPKPIDVAPMAVPEPVATPTDERVHQLIRRATDRQPVVQVALWRQKSAVAGYAVAKAGLYPGVSVGAGLNTAYSSAAPRELFPLGRQLQYNLGQYVRLSVSIPILNGQQVRLRTASALVTQKIAETDGEKAKQQLRQEIEQGFMALTIAFQKWQSAGKQVTAQQKALLSGKARYDEGLIHAIELATLQTNLTKALSNQMQARYEYYFRKLMLDSY